MRMFMAKKEVLMKLAFTLTGAIGVSQIIIHHDSLGVYFD